ncbi:D-alanyl-D-alanine carboxypeptidase (penicillin-binding protein 5/6) [Leucobacter komagatae]|uniref:D-alanyl-D-alanine carboxypeptidase (Penicillin-binding protein 5/6) n=1 Tax=Leucobacter komagatae TaxID=55969 RepID=A0A542Y735_9MICO|nr:D-alanyl-D-alanine carboxypeptidase [Leucobacter komagatae]TQL43912.1 D-alanyl-D-alanine carboxypeptidase (penicillin-binding protein 5/6) [Leucobacter komagatae]
MRTADPTVRSRRGRGVRVVAWALPAALLLGAGGYVWAAANAPLPEPTLTQAAAAEPITARADAPQAVVDERELPTAIGWLHTDDVWSNDGGVYPLASISKLITVLVCQEREPLAPGDEGRTYTWSAADRDRQNGYIALDGVAYPIPVGTEVTLREMLTLIFLPSANDFAAAYAYSVFGDNDTFVAAVRDWAERNGLESLEMVEPTGMDEGNRASAADLVRIARMALNNPTISEFTGTQSATMPWGIGVIENTNPLLGELPGMLGVKTGRSDSAGFNFIAAQSDMAGEREVVKISVTLARPSLQARAQSGREMLAAIGELPLPVEVVRAGEQIGTLTGVDGATVNVTAASAASTTLLPGETTKRTVELRDDAATAESPGTIRVEAPTGPIEVALKRDGELPEPDLWWRITHPSELFGWGGQAG